MSFVWTDQRVEALHQLWKDGHSASQIASRLGDVSRSAVLGKAFRDGLARRRPSAPGTVKPAAPKRKVAQQSPKPKPFRQKRSSPRTDFMVVPKAKTIKPVPTLAPDLEFNCEPVTSELRKGCMWIVGEVAAQHTLFCNEPKAFKSSWCEHHYHRVFQPARERA